MLRIKEIQQKKNIKNVELSALTGIGVQQISYYHTGHRTPPLSTLEKIAQALNCEMAELLPLGEDFMHIYNEQGEWQGIMKKPTL